MAMATAHLLAKLARECSRSALSRPFGTAFADSSCCVSLAQVQAYGFSSGTNVAPPGTSASAPSAALADAAAPASAPQPRAPLGATGVGACAAASRASLPAAAAAASAGQTASAVAQEGWAAVPAVTKVLGLSGAIPFLALSAPLAGALLPGGLAAAAPLLQLGYGATIASFLGGVHWGAAMAEYGGAALSARFATERYLWSVTPCLMAWPAVTLPPGPGALVLGGTLGVAYMVDRTFTQRGLLPRWYMSLRLPLTLLASGGLALTLWHSLTHAPQPPAAAPATRDTPSTQQIN